MQNLESKETDTVSDMDTVYNIREKNEDTDMARIQRNININIFSSITNIIILFKISKMKTLTMYRFVSFHSFTKDRSCY